MTHYKLPQRASKQVNASCTETSTKGFPPFRSHRQDLSYANTTIQAIIGLIDITDVTLAYRNSDLSTQLFNSPKQNAVVPISGSHAEDQGVKQQVYLLISTSVWTKTLQQNV